MRGEFILSQKDGSEIILPNTVTNAGAEEYLKDLFQGAALTGFFVGLCNQVPLRADLLTSIVTEPTIGVNGYARQPLAQNATDWPTVDTTSDESSITSKQVTFTAAGGDFDAAHSRLFLCSVLTGTAGILYSYSAALASPIVLVDGTSFDVRYRFYL